MIKSNHTYLLMKLKLASFSFVFFHNVIEFLLFQSGVKRNTSRQESTKNKKNPVVIGIVTIVLVEGKNLLAMDDNGYSDPYVKGRLGNERFKSKVQL